MIGTSTDWQFVELFGSAFADRDLGDPTHDHCLTNSRSVQTSCMATYTRRAALYVRVSTSDRGQTVENQLQPLQEAAGRLGLTVVAIYRDEGIVAPRGATSGLDWMLCSGAWRGESSTSLPHGRCVGWDDPYQT